MYVRLYCLYIDVLLLLIVFETLYIDWMVFTIFICVYNILYTRIMPSGVKLLKTDLGLDLYLRHICDIN